MNVYTTEDPASIYTRGPGGVGERARPRWTPDNRIVILHGLRSDPKIKEYNRVSVDMEPDTSWTIEAVDSEMSGKEEVCYLMCPFFWVSIHTLSIRPRIPNPWIVRQVPGLPL
jgi:hypothetical protein